MDFNQIRNYTHNIKYFANAKSIFIFSKCPLVWLANGQFRKSKRSFLLFLKNSPLSCQIKKKKHFETNEPTVKYYIADFIQLLDGLTEDQRAFLCQHWAMHKLR